MRRSFLIAYQFFIGLLDTSTGLLLIATPALALRLMKLHAAEDTLVYISYLGVFVLSVGLACLYGGLLAVKGAPADKLEVVWLLTAITRGLVAVFVVVKVASGAVEPGWSTVAFTDGTFTLIQSVGLARGWLRHARVGTAGRQPRRNHLSAIVSRAENLGEAAITSWGERASIRVLRVTNDNNFCILDYRAPTGFGPPRHLHYLQHEVLEILEGSIAVWTPDWCGVLHAGDIVSLPAGVPHTWRSIGDQALHFTVIVTPGGPGGFKEFFTTIQQRNLTIADISELVVAAEIGGMQIIGPPLSEEEVERLKLGEQL